jgi:hypothetical protein
VEQHPEAASFRRIQRIAQLSTNNREVQVPSAIKSMSLSLRSPHLPGFPFDTLIQRRKTREAFTCMSEG